MSIFSRFFNSQSRAQEGVDIRGVSVIPTKCPTCGQVGDLPLDLNKHDFFGIFEIDKKTRLHSLECPYCKAGMMLCIRDGRMLGIEPFKDDPPSDMLDAVLRARKRFGL